MAVEPIFTVANSSMGDLSLFYRGVYQGRPGSWGMDPYRLLGLLEADPIHTASSAELRACLRRLETRYAERSAA